MTQPHDTLIGSVPSRIVKSARQQVSAFEGRIAEYNVAVWLHVPGLANLPASLFVTFLDAGKRREVAVDHGQVNSHNKIMLSGVARLPFKQQVEDMQLQLRTAVSFQAITVEEMFVQAAELEQNASHQAFA
ncbi:hypothetical protein [Pseudomonas sp. M30-35]|uniref:hypothetical protein n=1 Tax=Pseudomonas sp. M30-35 TaxID=1981174 RepID=UPI000B3C37EB|nr:hypothetical protein [Pseudomonas sp. M30-35]ARU87805.1 hypothetical protein B9K09_07430 [Pseudomonas sp. M30-35]